MESVLLLRGQDTIENALQAMTQSAVVAVLQGVDRAFQGLVEIRIESVVALERTVEYTRNLVEVGDVPVLIQGVQRVGDRHLVLGFQARPPRIRRAVPPAREPLLPARAAAADQPGQRRVELPPSSSCRGRGGAGVWFAHGFVRSCVMVWIEVNLLPLAGRPLG